MRRLRFSLRWLFGVVSLMAIGCGLMIYASPWMSKLAFTAALVAVMAAIPAAIFQSGQRRAFWSGFTALGLAYVWAICGSWQSPDGSQPLRESLVTSEILVRCHELLPYRQTSVTPSDYFMTGYSSTALTGQSVSGYTSLPPAQLPRGAVVAAPLAITAPADRADFMTAGHAMFTIVIGLLGGAIASGCYARGIKVSASAR